MSALSIGVAVRSARKAAGLSQTELGALMAEAGFQNWRTVTLLSRLENGERQLTWEEGLALRGLIAFSDSSSSASTASDAIAYRRILAVIGEREAAAAGPVEGLEDVRRDFELEAVLS